MSTNSPATLAKAAFGPCKPHRRGLFGWVTWLHGIWVERRALKGMEAHRLRDLGITRGQAAQEGERPAWDAPERWLR